MNLTIAAALVTALIAVATYRLSLYNQPCNADPMVSIPGFADSVDPCKAFSNTYQEARASFKKAANDVGATLHSLPIVAENDFTMDIAVLPGGEPLVVHTSGVHGVEGFAGSSIQTAYLQARKQHPQTDPPTVILVHAFNPFGMALYRRFNKHNVDLNRNGLTESEWESYATDHYNREVYERFDGLFNPPQAPTLFSAYILFWFRAALAIVQNGISTLRAAMVGGQYHKQQGIFYGGAEVEPSINVLWDFMADYLSQNNHSIVTWIDVHTGLGKFGIDTVIGRNETELSTWFPDSQSQFDDDSDIQQGYEHVKGYANDYYQRLFSSGQLPLMVTQEFGTLPNVLVGHALIVENAAYHYLDADKALEWATWTTKRAFYPQSQLWRKKVLEKGILVLLQAIERSRRLSEQMNT